MEKGNFDLRSWTTNCDILKEQLVRDKKYTDHGCELEKILGYKYNTKNDCMYLSSSEVNKNVTTKRGILSQISSLYDPLSVFLPVTIRGRILMRDLWENKYDWDQEVSPEFIKTWLILANDLCKLSSISFPRFTLRDDRKFELYVFCDASQNAYGFSAYAAQDGISNLIFAKSKVAPMKRRSLPTLELLGVYIALKNISVIMNTYKGLIENIFINVDAQIVLSWLLTDVTKLKTKNIYAKNRIKDIKVMVDDIGRNYNIEVKFKYVSTQENPADLLTRGLTFDQFNDNLKFWFNGPDWINKNPIVYPVSNLECLTKVQKTMVQKTILKEVHIVEPVVSFERYSSIDKLINVTAAVFKAVNKFKKSSLNNELESAKIYLIKTMQSQEFEEELKFLKSKENKNPPNLVKSLNLFLDKEGILRSYGRIEKTQIYNYDLFNPILLAKTHNLTKLFIIKAHESCKHLGISATLNNLRLSGFWVPKARQCVKNALSSCFICNKFNSLSFRYPKVTNLPKSRVNLVKPFYDTGIDYTGHIWVKCNNVSVKMYILLFTCLNIRSVHIELVQDMSTQSFIQALIRFTNLFGVPARIYSDNARSFNAALSSNIIENHLSSNLFCNKFQVNNIKHIKIPLYSPWMGSVWERLIKTVKSCLYKTIGKSKIEYFEFLTLLSDIQNAINARPLTYRCSSDSGLEIITPNSFLKPYSNSELFLNINDEVWDGEPPRRSDLLVSLEAREINFEKFKRLWYEEYLLSLRETYKDLYESKFCNKIKLEDVVLIKNSLKPRPYWQLGRVIELFPGQDNKIRIVKIRLGNGSEQIHALNHLYPLELNLTHDVNTNRVIDDDEEIDTSHLNLDYKIDEIDKDLGLDLKVEPSKINNSRPRRANAGMRGKNDTSYLYY